MTFFLTESILWRRKKMFSTSRTEKNVEIQKILENATPSNTKISQSSDFAGCKIYRFKLEKLAFGTQEPKQQKFFKQNFSANGVSLYVQSWLKLANK